MTGSYDVAVIGAGPVGSLCALGYARKGATVVLLESNPKACHRFAGEWLHPPGVSVLDALRAGRLDGTGARTGYGFVVFPDDGSEPIELSYPHGQTALACEHSRIVESLRARAADHPLVDYRPHTRVRALAGQQLEIDDRTRGAQESLRAARIVGADGRASIARAELDAAEGCSVGHMASVVLRAVSLPNEGFGHVVLGGPGPILMYRIDADTVRVCLDLPADYGKATRTRAFLWEAYRMVMPEPLREPLRRALRDEPLLWATTRFRPRTVFGAGHIALVGDAAGYTHPLTAVGITQGFRDVHALIEADSIDGYQRTREAQSYSPELLSNALYHVFRRRDPAAEAIRRAIYSAWRQDPAERARTMALLVGDQGNAVSFGRAFTRIASGALVDTLQRAGEAGGLRGLPATIGRFAEFTRWPAAAMLPGVLRRRLRPLSSSEQPLMLAQVERNAVAVPESPAPQGDLTRAARRVRQQGVKALLDGLVLLAPQVALKPKAELGQVAAPMLWAMERAHLQISVARRLELARRRLATEAVPVYLAAIERGTLPRPAEQLATVLMAMLDVRQGPVQVRELARAVSYLLSCQSPEGGFGPAIGSAPSLQATAVVARTLRACGELSAVTGGSAQPLERAADWVARQQRADGSFGDLESTCDGLVALASAGGDVHASALASGIRWLTAQQGSDGLFASWAPDGFNTAQVRSARAQSALIAAGFYDLAVLRKTTQALLAAAPALLESPRIKQSRRLVGDPDAAAALCALLHALADYGRVAGRGGRPARDLASQGQTRAAPRVRPISPELPQELQRDWAFCAETLREVSRTFSRPIQFLPDDLQVAVTCAYLLCRIADTIEDTPDLPHDTRDRMFAALLEVMQGADASELEHAFARIEDPDNEVELTLGRQTGRVMRVYHGLAAELQDACTPWISEMVRGMALYGHREPGPDGIVALHSVGDLERYCFYVAGTVGQLLTEVFVARLGSEMRRGQIASLRRYAESFGQGLQLVNILKDITDDADRGWSYIPRSRCADEDVELSQLFEPGNRKRARAVVAPLMDMAERLLDEALEYTLAIPDTAVGVRMFCLLPLWMAVATLREARSSDAMFEPGRPVKISRSQVESLISNCARDCTDDTALRAQYRALRYDTPRAVRSA